MDIKQIEINGEVFPVEDSEARNSITAMNTTIAEQAQTIAQLQQKINSLVIPVFNNTEMIDIIDSVNIQNQNIVLDSIRAVKQFGWVQLTIYGKINLTKTTSTNTGFTISDERFFVKTGTLSSAIMAGYATFADWEMAIGRLTAESENTFKVAEQSVSGQYELRTVITYPAKNP